MIGKPYHFWCKMVNYWMKSFQCWCLLNWWQFWNVFFQLPAVYNVLKFLEYLCSWKYVFTKYCFNDCLETWFINSDEKVMFGFFLPGLSHILCLSLPSRGPCSQLLKTALCSVWTSIIWLHSDVHLAHTTSASNPSDVEAIQYRWLMILLIHCWISLQSFSFESAKSFFFKPWN